MNTHWEGTLHRVVTPAVFSVPGALIKGGWELLRTACPQNMFHHHTAEQVDQREGERLHSWAEGCEQPTVHHLATSPHQQLLQRQKDELIGWWLCAGKDEVQGRLLREWVLHRPGEYDVQGHGLSFRFCAPGTLP